MAVKVAYEYSAVVQAQPSSARRSKARMAMAGFAMLAVLLLVAMAAQHVSQDGDSQVVGDDGERTGLLDAIHPIVLAGKATAGKSAGKVTTKAASGGAASAGSGHRKMVKTESDKRGVGVAALIIIAGFGFVFFAISGNNGGQVRDSTGLDLESAKVPVAAGEEGAELKRRLAQLQQADERIRRQAAELQALEGAKAKAEAAATEARAEKNRAEAEVKALKGSTDKVTKDAQKAVASSDKLDKELREAKGRVGELETQVATLTQQLLMWQRTGSVESELV